MTQLLYPYAKQNITQADIKAVEEALWQSRITRGEKTEAFEQQIAQDTGARYAVAFSSATAGLYAALYAAEAQPQDRFFVPANTFIATAGCGIALGLHPRFVATDRNSGAMNVQHLHEIAKVPSSRGKTIVIPVHFAGIAVDMTSLERCLHDEEVVIIEDAAHAIGSLYPTGEKVGSCAKSHMTVFSFHPAKTITCGEGGVVTTNSNEFYHRLKRYRNNGIEREGKYLKQGTEQPGYYEVQAVTGNFHMTEMQAALGYSQFTRLDDFVSKRRVLVKCYRNNLANLPHLRFFSEEYDGRSAYHIMVVQIDFQAYKTSREVVMKRLLQAGIGTEVHYIPLYKHPALAKYNTQLNCEETEAYYREALTLPLYVDLREEDVAFIAKTLRDILTDGP